MFNSVQLRQRDCPGTLPRRAFLRAGLAGWGALSLADLLRCEALSAPAASATLPALAHDRSMIVLWLWGGPSHMETFDLKPDAPSEYRGQFRPIPTNVPGLLISEHLPLLAQQADKFALIRSCHHDSPGHVNSTHTFMTGYPGETVETPPYHPKYPDFFAVANKLLGERTGGAPARVAMPRTRYEGAAYLTGGLDPLVVTGDPNLPDFRVPNLALNDIARGRFDARLDLLARFDRMRRDIDGAGVMDSLDIYNRKAVSLLTTGAVHRAFDLRNEDPSVRDRYGRTEVGQRCLLARRLVQAGVRTVTIDFPCVPGQKAFSWDDHASVWNIFDQMKIRLPVLDKVVSALVQDLHATGLAEKTLLVVMGEMSHTPRLSNFEGQPGREHWSRSMSIFLSGGGLPMGQAIGSTTRTGEEPQDRALTPNDVLATWYKYLGIPLETQFPDHAGRPTPILPHGKPIAELI